MYFSLSNPEADPETWSERKEYVQEFPENANRGGKTAVGKGKQLIMVCYHYLSLWATGAQFCQGAKGASVDRHLVTPP